MEGIIRCLLESGSWYSKGKYRHYEKDGNDDQGIVRVGGFVSPTGYLYIEGRGGDGTGMCNLEVLYQKGEICRTYTMGKQEETPLKWANIYGAGVL